MILNFFYIFPIWFTPSYVEFCFLLGWEARKLASKTLNTVTKSSWNNFYVMLISFFYSGNSLGKELFRKILKRIYPGKDEDTIQRYLDIVFEAMSPSAGKNFVGNQYSDFAHSIKVWFVEILINTGVLYHILLILYCYFQISHFSTLFVMRNNSRSR